MFSQRGKKTIYVDIILSIVQWPYKVLDTCTTLNAWIGIKMSNQIILIYKKLNKIYSSKKIYILNYILKILFKIEDYLLQKAIKNRQTDRPIDR